MICSVCTGRHHTRACAVASRYLEQCAEPTPDDWTPPDESNVVELITAHTHRRASPHRFRPFAPISGIRVG